MQLEILTPEKKLYSGEVYGVQLPGITGLFEILDKHAPLVSALGKGNIKILKDKNTLETFSIISGFVEVLNNKATVLVEGAVAVADALKLAPGYDHVSFVFPGSDELTITLDVGGTPVGFAHGHQFGRDPMKWWAGQSHGMQPIGSSTLLLGAHLHHLKVEQSGVKTFIQIPALDGGSTWWRHRTGQDSPAGMVTLLIGHGGWSDLAVL
jgi:F-type H+-transporting ATPase subunit epsilon